MCMSGHMMKEKDELTRREMEVISCILIGEKTYKTTGKLLGISPKTVETHLRRVIEKHHCLKSELINIIGYEKLQTIYQSIGDTVIEGSFRKKRDTKLIAFLVTIPLSMALVGGYFLFRGDISFCSNIRIENNFYLIPRKGLIQEIVNILKKQEGIKTVVISGVGGAGKTTLARNFIKKQSSKLKWEIGASTEQDLAFSFRKLARYLAKATKNENLLHQLELITDTNNRREEIIAFVSETLKNIPGWILLFDNVQNLEVAKRYIPIDANAWGNGSVVITTRDSKLGENYPDRVNLKIPEITSEEQIDLFLKINANYSTKKSDKEKLRAFLEDIPKLPLDSAIAAYYIKNTGTELKDYLKYLQECSAEFQKVQHKIAINNINYDKTRFGIIASDFNKIIKDNPNFKELLLFISMINCSCIKISFLKRFKPGFIVDNFIYELQKYSLAEVKQEFCNIHKFTHKVGFHYIITQFSENEIKGAIDKMMEFMAPGYVQVQQLTLEDRLNLSQHIESLLRRIDSLKIDPEQKKRYKLRLSNALLHCYMNFKPRNFVKEFAQEIISENDNILPEKDLIKLLEICGNYNLISQDYDAAGKYISECLSVCGEKTEFQHMKAICLLDLAVLSEIKGNLSEAKQRRKQAFEFVNFSKENWSLSTKLDLFSRFYRYYKELFVHSREFKHVIDLGNDILKDLKADRFFYKENSYSGKEQEQIFSMRRYFIALYNKVGDFETALENVRESEFFFELIKKAGISFIHKEATFRMREGYTFLRLNKLDDAERVLKRCIQVHKELGETPCVAQALLYLTEVLMRQNKFDEAYECTQQSLKRMDKASSNNDRFFKATCHYFLSIMKLQHKKYPEALSHFNEFLVISRQVCGAMLDRKIYNDMVRNRIFSKVLRKEEMLRGFNTCAVEIFKNVYEPSHPFITDFVYKYGLITDHSLK